VRRKQYEPNGKFGAVRPGGEHPPGLPHPNGWFCIGLSHEWTRSTVLTRPFMGEDLVVYRTAGGTLHACRPYCPHLGAHLGAGGTVEGEHIVCPFHRFAFDGQGRCVKTPYGSPPRLALENLTVREVHGIAWVWHHSDAQPPTWELPEPLPGGEGHRPIARVVDIASHPQEILENPFDYRHLPQLHHLEIEELTPPSPDGTLYRLHLRVARRIPLFGSTLAQEMTGELIGLGGMHLVIDVSKFGFKSSAWLLPTPIGPWTTRIWILTSAELNASANAPRWLVETVLKPLARAISHAMLRWAAKDTSTDFPIWHHKRYLAHPGLNSADGPIGAYRRWARQFYPRPNSAADRHSGASAAGPVSEKDHCEPQQQKSRTTWPQPTAPSPPSIGADSAPSQS